MTKFDREIFFNLVRDSLFEGSMSQQQVDGMNFKLGTWELLYPSLDLRWLAYPLATAYHETGQRMYPVREGFCETDAEARAYVKKHGYTYAKVEPETGQVYYGRGDVQMTWADNYKKATAQLELASEDDLYWYPEKALDPTISAMCMYRGMQEGWYRKNSSTGKRETLTVYFNNTRNDPYTAREIINGDKAKIPSWSHGISVGNLIKGYHEKFLKALEASMVVEPGPKPKPSIGTIISIQTDPGTPLTIIVNGEELVKR